MISNSLITSNTLTSEEKTILFHILSLPDDWVIYKDYFKKHYRGCISDGKIDKAWMGLKTKGHLISTRVKGENGKFSSWKYEVREVPFTDIPESDMSENRTVENSTSQKLGGILNTNEQSTNLESINVSSTNIILGETKSIKNPEKKKYWTDIEIQRDINFKAFNSIFEKYGTDWQFELNSITPEMFIKKYVKLYSEDIDESRLKNLVENYIKLNPEKINNSQPPRRG